MKLSLCFSLITALSQTNALKDSNCSVSVPFEQLIQYVLIAVDSILYSHRFRNSVCYEIEFIP